MADGPPRNLRALQDRLRNFSRTSGKPFGRVQRLMSVLVVTKMLADADLDVVKGGTNLEVRLGIEATRASSDLDIVRGSTVEGFRTSLEPALTAGWNGFGGRVVDRGPIGAPVPDAYRPHRLEVKLEYQGKPVSTVTLEIAVEEAGA